MSVVEDATFVAKVLSVGGIIITVVIHSFIFFSNYYPWLNHKIGGWFPMKIVEESKK